MLALELLLSDEVVAVPDEPLGPRDDIDRRVNRAVPTGKDSVPQHAGKRAREGTRGHESA